MEKRYALEIIPNAANLRLKFSLTIRFVDKQNLSVQMIMEKPYI